MEAVTRPCKLGTGLLLLALAAGPRACAGQEARAAARGAQTPPPGTSLLGGLSLGSKSEPIAITADSLVFDNRSRVLTYEGGVVVTQGDLRLESQTLMVTLDDQAESGLKEVVAIRNVRLAKGNRKGTAGRAVFDQRQRTVVLSERPVLHDGPNQVSGDQVTVYLDEERAEVTGGVRAVLVPSQEPPAAGEVTP